jgi:cell wall-associated NlpC family hydrolase
MMSARMIVKRATSQIGVAYRLHGRLPGTALDCAGLAGYAALGKKASALPIDYTLRGDYAGRVHPVLKRARFRRFDNVDDVIPGDIILCQTAPRQVHLMVVVADGFIHGHAGLRRVVMTPAPSPWPIVSVWRRS